MAALLADAARAFPRAGLTRRRCGSSTAACCRWSSAHGPQVALLKESQVVDHAAGGHPGLVSIFSVRYTTARHTAEVAVDTVVRRLGRARRAGATATSRVASAGSPASRALLDEARGATLAGTDAALRQRLAGTYGTAWREVAPLASQTRTWPRRCRTAVRSPAPRSCTRSVARRRSRWPTCCCGAPRPARPAIPDAPAVEAAAALMATALGWDAARTAPKWRPCEAVYPAA